MIIYLVRQVNTDQYSTSTSTVDKMKWADIFKTVGSARARVTALRKAVQWDKQLGKYHPKYPETIQFEIVAFELIEETTFPEKSKK